MPADLQSALSVIVAFIRHRRRRRRR